ncbi:hypothetical protein MGN01_44360 [Methylobacterium gnaphalii]|uniref:Uncharacterized protein n=1 Tax=Methylobacterium gnaphalii TaxID=1010610 RepID=A0A512JRM7_9HYPH|nr:hypothetical protein MGN01_44360 [Methylobacterium gnaphalii]GLS48452.1 hypothetical protein GCM10007885_12960 [Methylobacterium gnaphalii]
MHGGRPPIAEGLFHGNADEFCPAGGNLDDFARGVGQPGDLRIEFDRRTMVGFARLEIRKSLEQPFVILARSPGPMLTMEGQAQRSSDDQEAGANDDGADCAETDTSGIHAQGTMNDRDARHRYEVKAENPGN